MSTSPLRNFSMQNLAIAFVSVNDGRVFQFEISQHVAAGAGEELTRLAAGDDIARFVRIEIRRLAQEIRIQRAGQALVGADDDDQFLLHFADLEERMQL